MVQISSPYGVTIGTNRQGQAGQAIGTQQITDMQGICDGGWIRYQLRWLSIEKTPGVYDWTTNLDPSVAICNAAHTTGNNHAVNILLPIQSAPFWRISIDVTNGNYIGPMTLRATAITHGVPITTVLVSSLASGSVINNGMIMNIGMEGSTVQESFQINHVGGYTGGATSFTVCQPGNTTQPWTPTYDHPINTTYITGDQLTGNYGLADPAAYAAFAALVANRYNGGAHGYLDAIQCGNEEFDAHGGNQAQRDYQGTLMSFALLKMYPAMRYVNGINPSGGLLYQGIIGACALCETYTGYYNHILNWHANMFANGVAAMIRSDTKFFTDFHFYRSKVVSVDPTYSNLPDTPSIAQTIARIFQAYAAANVLPQLWCNEFGWQFCSDKLKDTYYTDSVILTQAVQRDYTWDMFDALHQGKATRAMVYTEQPAATASYGTLPYSPNDPTPTGTFLSTDPRGLFLTFTANPHDPTPPGAGGGSIYLLAWSDPASGKGLKEYAAANPSWTQAPKNLVTQAAASFKVRQKLNTKIKMKFFVRQVLVAQAYEKFKVNSGLKPLTTQAYSRFLIAVPPEFALFPATSRRSGGFPATQRRSGTFPSTNRRKGTFPPTSRRESE